MSAHAGARPAERSPATKGAARKSTRHYTVNRTRARTLAGLYAHSFDEIAVLECLFGYPVKGAIALLIWAEENAPENPYRELRGWARRNGKGHYSRDLLRKPSSEVYVEYMAALEEERSRVESETGREKLNQAEVDRVTQEIYAPRTRAELSRISEASWRSFHEETERKHEAA